MIIGVNVYGDRLVWCDLTLFFVGTMQSAKAGL